MPAILPRMRFFFLLIGASWLSGCIATGVSSVDADPEFNWDALKRDQILMSPLVDLRPGGGEAFFTDKERFDYPEAFKQVFFKLRKDIRVFGAGGAFQHMAKIGNLPELARQALEKTPLADSDAQRIKTGSQEIRFVFFFAVTAERITHDYSYSFRSDQRDDVARYMTRRELTVKLALWDTTTNKTVWIATENLTPTDVNTITVSNPAKQRRKRGNSYVWVGPSLASSLARELQIHASYFPRAPGREPAFSKSFDDFALALPIQPSEAKLIEYEHFTYHRPELGLATSQIGKGLETSLFLGFSSAINYRLRFGGGIYFPLFNPTLELDGEDIDVAMLAYGGSFDYEWELSPTKRLLMGLFAGGAAFTKTYPEDVYEDDPEAEDRSETDGTFAVWPRVHALLGEKGGFQWGFGGSYRYFGGIEDEFLKVHKPAPWSIDLKLAYAFRGF